MIGIAETGNLISIHGIEVLFDTRTIFGLSFSGSERACSVDLSTQSANDKGVAPGSVQLSVRVTPDQALTWEYDFASRADSYVEVRDGETDERLERLPLSVQSVIKPAGSRDSVALVWTLSIGTYR